jgi:HprK-related kinase A
MAQCDTGSPAGIRACGPGGAGDRLTVAELGEAELARRLTGPGLRLRTGPVVTEVRSPLQAVANGIALLYAEHAVSDGFADFHVRVGRPAGLRRWLKPQVVFQFDGAPPFNPLPGDQGFPILEWGLNWCVSANCHQYLILHAAVVERSGHALVLPAPPGAGKSTLCAGLISRGWRLLSDELALLSPASVEIMPLARPISLKNASIELIARFAPDALIGPTVHDTLKGSVAHVKPPTQSVRRDAEPAMPRWIVVPRYVAGARAELQAVSKARAFMQLVESAFNYDLHGARGFEVIARIIESSACFEFTYSNLEEAAELFDALAAAQ